MNILALMAANTLPIVCIICATILLLKGNKEGWGWLVFLAFTSAVGGTSILKVLFPAWVAA